MRVQRRIQLILVILCGAALLTFSPGKAQGNVRISPANLNALTRIATFTVKAQGARGISGVSINADDTLIGLAMRDKTVRVWRLADGQEQAVLKGHEGVVNAVSFSPADGGLLASASSDRTIIIWDLTPDLPDQEPMVLGPARAAVMSMAFSPDGAWMASGAIDDLVTLWEVATGNREKVFQGHTGAVMGVAFDPTSRVLASVGVDRTVRLWDVYSLEMLNTINGPKNQLLAVAFSPDSRLIAAGERAAPKSTVHLWDAQNNQPVAEFGEVSGQLASLTFNPDGSLLAVGTGKAAIELWDVAAQSKLATLYVQENAAPEQLTSSVVFSADGTLLVASSGPDQVAVWAVR